MSIKTPIFRNSMGGFNKKDVTDYIARLNREFTDTLAEKDDEIAKLKKKLAELESSLSEANTESKDETAAELERANNLIAVQNEQLEGLNSKVNSLEAELSEVNSKLEFYNDKVSQYDTMANRMGEIFMDATADAERIRNDARETCEALMAKTDAECKERRSTVEEQLGKLVENRRLEISKLLSDAQLEIGSVLENFENKSKALVTVTMRDAGITDNSEPNNLQ